MNDVSFLIPARGGSRRIPHKNLLRLNGETLVARKVRQLLPLGKVYVGTDDDEIFAEAEKAGAIALRREKTNEGCDSANEMIKEFVGLIAPCETVVWAHCTNPLLSTQTYGKALKFFEAVGDRHDSLVSVHAVRGHFWDSSDIPLYDLRACRTRHICAADLPPIYEQDGGIFIQPYEQIKRNCYFFGDTPVLFSIPDDEFCDINTWRDWQSCQALINFRES